MEVLTLAVLTLTGLTLSDDGLQIATHNSTRGQLALKKMVAIQNGAVIPKK